MKIKNFFVSAAFLSAVIFSPVAVFADHTIDHALQQIRDRFNGTLESVLTVRITALSDSALASLLAAIDENKIKKLEDELRSYKSQIQELKSGPQTAGNTREIKSLEDEVNFVQTKLEEARNNSGLKLVRTLRHGSVGDDVKRLQEFLAKDNAVYPEGLVTGYFGKLTEGAVKKFQEKNGVEAVGIVGPKTRAKLLEIFGAIAVVEPGVALERGASGGNVTELQGFLKRFPDIYPEGIISGYFGDLTEAAIKRLQEKLGLESGGTTDVKTRKKVGELTQAINRKQMPKISAVLPDAIFFGAKVTLAGSGFTLENNSLFVRGKVILTGLTSHDGTEIVFSVPADIPCVIGRACPIKIVNANGISNAKPVIFVEAIAPPVPEPLPEPIPEPAPAPAPATVQPPTVFLSADQITVTAGQPFSLTVSGTSDVGLAAVWWYGNSTGVVNATVASSYPATPASSAWFTTLVTNPTILDRAFGSPLFSAEQAVRSYSFSSTVTISAAGIYEFKANSRDVLYPVSGEPHQASEGSGTASVKITVVAPMPLPPPAAPALTNISPSIVTTGMAITIHGSGFTPVNNTVIFTGSFMEPNQVIGGVASSDGATLRVVVPAIMPCRPIVVSQCSVFVTNQNGQSNGITFWLGQHIDPVTVISPNGGERITQGIGTTIRVSGGKSEAFGGAISIGMYLVPSAATMASDPTDLIIGSIGGYAWDAHSVIVGYVPGEPLMYADVPPGDYKILVVGTDILNKSTIWDPITDTPGNIDISDAPFTVLPAPIPALTVVSPNGGEAYKFGDAATITWNAENIASRSINIKLLKSGSVVSTIASNVPQSTATGLFLYNWIIPNGLAVGSDYAIEISDATNAAVKDASDGKFRVASNASLQIYGPNGGDVAMRGFSALLFWTYSGYTPVSVNVNLYKGGAFYRTLAANVVPVGFSGATFLKASYPYNSRYAEIPLALDIPEGDDYALEIVDGADSAIRDMSDAPFRIISLPNPVTFTGRMIDSVSGAAMPNISFTVWSGNSWTSAFTTGPNGEFSYSADVSGFLDPATRFQSLFNGIPQCNDATALSLSRYPDFPRTAFGGWFGGLYPLSSVRRQYLPITGSVMNLGDVPMWPTADFIHTFNDIGAGFMVYYSVDGRVQGGTGNINKTFQNGLQNTPPLGADVYIQYTDKFNNSYSSPVTKFDTNIRCPIAANSFMDGAYRWEPYPIGIYSSLPGGIVGTSYAGMLQTYAYGGGYGYSAGTAPYVWSILGSLPPGLSLNSATGEITGAPTAVGIYSFGVKVIDANGVRASATISLTIR